MNETIQDEENEEDIFILDKTNRARGPVQRRLVITYLIKRAKVLITILSRQQTNTWYWSTNNRQSTQLTTKTKKEW